MFDFSRDICKLLDLFLEGKNCCNKYVKEK